MEKMRQTKDELEFLYQLVFDSNLFNQNELSPRSLSILEMRWKYNYSFGIISKQLNISAQRASQIYHSSLKKIRQSVDILSSRAAIDSNTQKLTDVIISALPDFNPRLKSELHRSNILTLQQLSNYTKDEIVKHKRISNKSADYLQEILNEHQLDFKK